MLTCKQYLCYECIKYVQFDAAHKILWRFTINDTRQWFEVHTVGKIKNQGK